MKHQPEIKDGQGNKLKTDIIKITPELAKEWLTRNLPTNRRLSDRSVLQLEHAITKGQWRVTGDSIKFDANDALIDGQHRLRAVIRAGRPIESRVVWGVSSDSFDAIDRGRIRTPAAILGIRGEKNTAHLAAALRILYCYRAGAMHEMYQAKDIVTPQDLEDLLEKEGGMRESVRAGMRAKDILSPGSAAFLHYIFSQQDQGLCKVFFDRLVDGEELKKTDTLYKLRDKLIKLRMKSDYRSAYAEKFIILGMCINAWNILRGGTNRRAFIYDPENEFPEAL